MSGLMPPGSLGSLGSAAVFLHTRLFRPTRLQEPVLGARLHLPLQGLSAACSSVTGHLKWGMGAGCPPSTPLGVGASYRSPQVGNGYGIRRSPSAHQTPERVGASSPVTSMGNGCGILLSSPATLAGERCRLRSGPPSERWASGGSGRALLSTESSYPCRVAYSHIHLLVTGPVTKS